MKGGLVGLLALVFVLGCPSSEETFPVATPTPAELDFGEVPVGERVFMDVALRNDSFATLRIYSASIVEDGTPFDAASAELEVRPNEEALLGIPFRPLERGEFTATLAIETNANPAIIEVPLRGVGVGGELSFAVEELDFGDRPVGCGGVETVTLRNDGNIGADDLTLILDGSDALSVSGVTSPFSLDAGASVDLELTWTGLPAGTLSGDLTVYQSDQALATVDVAGEATPIVTTETQVEVTPDFPPVDFVFAVDTAADMDTVQSRLGLATGLFVTEGLEDAAIDWRVGVISADASGGGFLLSPMVDENTPTPGLAIKEDLESELAFSMPGRGLAMLYEAIASGGNPGIHRPGAGLALVVVTTGDDVSGTPPAPFTTWLDALLSLVDDDPTLLTVTMISGGEDGCSTSTVTASAAPTLLESAWRGQDTAVCPSSLPLWPIAYGPNIRSVFEVTGDVHPASVEVQTISGDQPPATETDWTWDADRSAVVFEDGSLPQPGDTVLIRYVPPSICSE